MKACGSVCGTGKHPSRGAGLPKKAAVLAFPAAQPGHSPAADGEAWAGFWGASQAAGLKPGQEGGVSRGEAVPWLRRAAAPG